MSNQRCAKCILPSSYPNIQFDDNGVCNECLSAPKNPVDKKPEKELETIINQFKGKSRKYDLILPLSGGKDSSYTAYYLKKKFDVKMLGLNYDIGYRSALAVRNIEKLSDELDMDLITIRLNKKFLAKLFSHFLRERGEFCSVCNNIGYLLAGSFCWAQAQLLGFPPLIVGGWSKHYEHQPGVSTTNMKYFFNNLTENLLDELKKQPFFEENIINIFHAISDPRQAQLGNTEYKHVDKIAVFIQLPDYIDWNIREIPHILSSETGWEHSGDIHESHFDCKLFPIKEYLKFKKYGLTQETIKNSRLIREGLMSREEGLERMKFEHTEEPLIFQTFLNELGLTPQQINWKAEWSKN